MQPSGEGWRPIHALTVRGAFTREPRRPVIPTTPRQDAFAFVNWGPCGRAHESKCFLQRSIKRLRTVHCTEESTRGRDSTGTGGGTHGKGPSLNERTDTTDLSGSTDEPSRLGTAHRRSPCDNNDRKHPAATPTNGRAASGPRQPGRSSDKQSQHLSSRLWRAAESPARVHSTRARNP